MTRAYDEIYLAQADGQLLRSADGGATWDVVALLNDESGDGLATAFGPPFVAAVFHGPDGQVHTVSDHGIFTLDRDTGEWWQRGSLMGDVIQSFAIAPDGSAYLAYPISADEEGVYPGRVVRLAGHPGSLSDLEATARRGSIDVSWNEPSFTGGTPISAYRVVLRGAEQHMSEFVLADEPTRVRFENLPAGEYEVTVSAMNVSLEREASVPVTVTKGARPAPRPSSTEPAPTPSSTEPAPNPSSTEPAPNPSSTEPAPSPTNPGEPQQPWWDSSWWESLWPESSWRDGSWWSNSWRDGSWWSSSWWTSPWSWGAGGER